MTNKFVSLHNSPQLPPSRGQLTSVESLSVVFASDGSFPITIGAKGYKYSTAYLYSGTPVDTTNWTQLIASTAAASSEIFITDQSGEVMELGIGAAAAEARVFLIPRGFSGSVPLSIASGSRISVRAITATASSGEIVLTGLG